MNSKDRCPQCSGGGLVPAPGCACAEKAHGRMPMICNVCGGAGCQRHCRFETARDDSS
jgi:hypothetical protein